MKEFFMPIDLICGQCEGQMQADEPGSIVACPHCGTHLQVPAVESGQERAAESVPNNVAAISTEVMFASPADSITSSLVPAEIMSPMEPTVIDIPEKPSAQTLAIEEPLPPIGSVSMSELPSHSALNLSARPAEVPTHSASETPAPPPPAATPQPQGMPEISGYTAPVAATVPRSWFLFMLSYSSAVTLAFVFTLISLARVKSHPLESLPDVVPKIQNGEVALQVASPESNVAPGHVLALGESRRFGSIKVTPQRVTQGVLRFEHHLKAAGMQRSPSEPVLKLWVRFENVSRNQTFAPLDSLLLFKRHYQDFGNTVLTNQFLCRTDERKKGGQLRHLFELSATSEFLIAGQNLETVLAPGQSLETFIPSEEQIDKLNGDLVWRVQFRKGYHPRTRHGVTTLIDVPFNRTDVKNES